MTTVPLSSGPLREAIHDIVALMAPTGGASVYDDARLVFDLGFDSLRLIELAVVVEQRFALPPINLDHALAVTTVRDLVALVAAQTGEGGT